MPEPTDPYATTPPCDPSASSDTSPHGCEDPSFGPPATHGEIGTLGPYRVLKRLGKGGMGAVYLAVDTRLNRKLALKVMLPEFAANPEAKERFLREARAAAQVSHDNVVTVYEADERDGVPYITMQYLQGESLDEFLKNRGVPPLVHAVRIAAEAAAGLGAAHELGLIHRDIKPANLWLESPNGRAKVLDFGLARPVATESELTRSGAVIGTPAYMSPEQAHGARIDARGDLWSLGAVLYKLCTGRSPFGGANVLAVLLALANDEPTPVRDLNPQVPEPLADLIHQLLAKRPEHRPQTAAEVVERLRHIHDALLYPAPGSYSGASRPTVQAVPLSVTAAPDSAFAALGEEDATQAESAVRPRPANAGGMVGPLFAAGVAAVAVLVAAGVLLAISSGGRSKSTEPAARPEPTPGKPKGPVGEPVPPGERRYTAAEIRDERVMLPEPDARQLIRTETFAEPQDANNDGYYWERGRFSISTSGTLWRVFDRLPADNFAVEAVVRTTGAPTERGGLVLRGKQVQERWHALQLLLNSTGELTVEPWVYADDDFRAANPTVHTFRTKSARAENANTLTAIVRDKYLEVYLNRAAVSNPLTLPAYPIDLVLQGLGDADGRAQFTAVRIWSVVGAPTPFQAK